MAKKEGRSRGSGQVQGGNAQEGPQRHNEELRNAAPQQYGTNARRKQALKHTSLKYFCRKFLGFPRKNQRLHSV
jgi:hypothetical protein